MKSSPKGEGEYGPISIIKEDDSRIKYWKIELTRVNVCKTGADNQVFDSLKFGLPLRLYLL